MTRYPFTPQQECLRQLSMNIWRCRGAAKRSGLNYNEETVTEGLLLDLQVNFPGNVLIVPFTKRREARVGADWAWVFVGPDGRSCQGMLVQAKRLDDDERDYGSLYKRNRPKGTQRAVFQVDRLIANAKLHRLVPIYAFYNHLSDAGRVPNGSCGTLARLNWSCSESWGVALAPAIKVRHARPDKRFDHHRCHSMPLHCLLCSWGSGEQGPMGSAGAAAAALSQLFDGGDEAGAFEPGLTPPFQPESELPELFREAERVHRSGKSDDVGMIAEFHAEFPGLAGVVIFRDSKDSERDFDPRASMPWAE